MKVIKRNGTEVAFDIQKIENAISKANQVVEDSAKMTRLHNDTNMMAIGAGVVGELLAFEIIDTWLETEFSHEERHQRRIDKVMALEKA